MRRTRGGRGIASVALALAALSSLIGTGLVSAAVAYDPSVGRGHIDKSDVQAAFGWKEGTFQANSRRVTFHAYHRAGWTWTCTIDGKEQQMTTDVELSLGVDAAALG